MESAQYCFNAWSAIGYSSYLFCGITFMMDDYDSLYCPYSYHSEHVKQTGYLPY